MTNLLELPTKARFSAELPADPITNNFVRQVENACFSSVATKHPGTPELVHLSDTYLAELGLSAGNQADLLAVLSGAKPFNKFAAYAMCYGGHQFGHWAGQLGDGRAINIAEVDANGQPLTLQLKGAGPTPYSRGADGLAVLRSSIREYLCSEAMHHLGVPTTRALSLVKTGDWVPRDMLYNGNQEDEHGAIVCRVAPSFIRFGSFEVFAARNDAATLRTLADFTIKHHYPHLGSPGKSTYVAFFKEVANRTREMIVHWQRVGFVHGVMNTDNLSILGLTIDYGPYGWLEDYDPNWTPNTTDAQNKRYRFGNQPSIALWNLNRLANALYPLIEEAEPLQQVLADFKDRYLSDYHGMMASKIGLSAPEAVSPQLLIDLTEMLASSEMDMTLFFRQLSTTANDDFETFWAGATAASYLESLDLSTQKEAWQEWHIRYTDALAEDPMDRATRLASMQAINPKYVLRNYMAQLAIDAANQGDYSVVDELYQLLLKPYAEQPEMEKWYAKRPEWARHKVGCSMLSCSS